MHRHNSKTLVRMIGLFAVTGFQSADLIPFSDTPDPVILPRSACQKADSMWNVRIVPSRYEQLPPLTSPGVFDLFKLLTSSFSVKALTSEGDELEYGRHKLIHAFGAGGNRHPRHPTSYSSNPLTQLRR